MGYFGKTTSIFRNDSLPLYTILISGSLFISSMASFTVRFILLNLTVVCCNLSVIWAGERKHGRIVSSNMIRRRGFTIFSIGLSNFQWFFFIIDTIHIHLRKLLL